VNDVREELHPPASRASVLHRLGVQWSVALAVLVGLGFIVSEGILLAARIRDYDEGVFWQTIRALARGDPLFTVAFATSPPAFFYLPLPFYLVGHSLASLRLEVLLLGVAGLIAIYVIGRLLSGPLAGLITVSLLATSAIYWHGYAIFQADGPSVGWSLLAIMLALLAVSRRGRVAYLLAAGAGLALALSVGTKFFGVLATVPVAVILLFYAPFTPRWGGSAIGSPSAAGGAGSAIGSPSPGDGGGSGRGLLAATVLGGLIGTGMVLIPIVSAPEAAYQQLIVSHLRAGEVAHRGLADNFHLFFLRRDLPLELVAAGAAVVAWLRRDRAAIVPLAWLVVAVVAVSTYQPMFPHHLIVLAPPLALLAGIGMARLRDFGPAAAGVGAVLVLGTVSVGAAVDAQELWLAVQPDLHDMEMTAAVRATGRPNDYWISDNAYAVAAADRNLPGPMVDSSRQLIASGLLSVDKLEAVRIRYDVKWVLSDSHRLEDVPGFHDWVTAHFRVVQRLGGGAVVYGR
jgi:hypothetical protein